MGETSERDREQVGALLRSVASWVCCGGLPHMPGWQMAHGKIADALAAARAEGAAEARAKPGLPPVEASERVAKLMEALAPWAIGDASDAEGARILTEALAAARAEGAESALPAADLARGARTLAQRDLVRAIWPYAGSALAEAVECEFNLLATREGQLVAECERLQAECERLREACKAFNSASDFEIDSGEGRCWQLLRAALAPPPAADGRNVYACGCSGSDGRCPVHGDYPVDAKGGSVGDETVLYSDRELAREVCALFDEAHGGTPMAALADRIARRIAEFRRACIAAPVARAERAEAEVAALARLCYRHVQASEGEYYRIVLDTVDRQARDHATEAEAIAAVRAAAGLDAGREGDDADD